MSIALEADRLTKTYGAVRALDDFSIAIPAGGVFGVLGPNGAGKSTLLRAVAGLLPATGAVRLGDVVFSGLSVAERARHVAYMPQTLPQDVALTVLETVIAALEASPSAAGAQRS